MMHYKKHLSFVLIAAVLMSVAGCSSIPKKFQRKKKERIIQPQVYIKQEFVKPYSNAYYYDRHYGLWKSWHQDLLKLLEGNQKRRRMAMDEVTKQLIQMQSYLDKEAGQDLQVQMDIVDVAIAQLEGPQSRNPSSKVRFSLEKSLRVIQSRFTPNDMEPSILSDNIEL